jgi:hypothetical protein
MSTAKSENNVDIKLYKKPFSISQLIIALVLGTYFLTVETIELSLSIYATQENKPEIYREYLLFKSQAPIWKWWQELTTLIIPLSVFAVISDLFQTLTKKATTKRNLIDIVAALQLFGVLFTVFTRVLPLETQLIKTASYDNASQLNFVHWIVFMLNIVGWFIPLFRYQDWKNDENVHPKKKIE